MKSIDGLDQGEGRAFSVEDFSAPDETPDPLKMHYL